MNLKSIAIGQRMLGLGRVLAGVIVLSTLAARADSVINSVHNLSVAGPGTIKAVSEKDACVFCHTVHRSNGEQPLWNHTMSGVTNYIVYNSPTLKAVVGQPDGSSRLCLSCHDGTVALGSVGSRSATIEMEGGVTTMPVGEDNLGTDLSGDHPISFVYDTALAGQNTTLNNPGTLNSKVKLDRNGKLQCTACHNPHDNQYGDFLVMDNTSSALCLVCHNNPNWTTSAHATSPQILTPPVIAKMAGTKAISKTAITKQGLTASTVSIAACNNCHATHQAATKQYLMKFPAPEQNCLVCHDGSAAAKNVSIDFQKSSVHPITINSAAHKPNEDPVNPETRHVTCVDCHDPHAANAQTAVKPAVSGALAGVKGITAAGGIIQPVDREYELCFRCHGDSVVRGPATVTRQFIQTNTRLQFASANQSFHPVEAQGQNVNNVPSLIAPLTTASLTACTDCHNSDSSPAEGGSGANGPHGSIFAPILERNLNIQDFQGESAQAYALCYKCHSRDSILANQSFNAVNGLGQERGHRFHIVDQSTACTTCHDSHGVANVPHLINFNTSYVTPGSNGRLEFVSTGSYSGNCSLTCHGKDHDALAYPGTASILRLRKH